MPRSHWRTAVAAFGLLLLGSCGEENEDHECSWDAGALVSGDKPTRDFVVVNHDGCVWTVQDIGVSCSCLTIGASPKIVNPGDSLNIHCEVDTNGFAGTQLRTGYVKLAGPRTARIINVTHRSRVLAAAALIPAGLVCKAPDITNGLIGGIELRVPSIRGPANASDIAASSMCQLLQIKVGAKRSAGDQDVFQLSVRLNPDSLEPGSQAVAENGLRTVGVVKWSGPGGRMELLSFPVVIEPASGQQMFLQGTVIIDGNGNPSLINTRPGVSLDPNAIEASAGIRLQLVSNSQVLIHADNTSGAKVRRGSILVNNAVMLDIIVIE